MFKKPIWNDSSFVTWWIILLEVAIRGCGIWNDAQLALRGLKCAKKNSPHNYTTTTSPHIGNKAWWIHVLILFMPNSDSEIETHQTTQHFSILQLSNFGELLEIVASFSYLKWRWVVAGGVFWCCSPSTSRLCVLWLHKCFAAYLGCNKWLFQSKLLFNQLKSVGPFFSDN